MVRKRTTFCVQYLALDGIERASNNKTIYISKLNKNAYTAKQQN